MIDDPSLAKVEAWLAKNRVASSALGRRVVNDQSLVSRWRSSPDKVTESKRTRILAYIEAHPDGIPGYKGAGFRRAYQKGGGKFVPDKTDRMGPRAQDNPSTDVPVPALSECSDGEWIRRVAFSRGMPLSHFLAELVHLGIMVYKDTEAEEAKSNQGSFLCKS